MRAIPRINESCAYIASDRSVTFYGCEGVLEYSLERVVLRLCDTIVTVSGKELRLSMFVSAEITVMGRIVNLGIERRGRA